MHLEGLSGHRGSSIPLQHSVITQKLLQKANIEKKKRYIFFGGGGGENRAAANHSKAQETGNWAATGLWGCTCVCSVRRCMVGQERLCKLKNSTRVKVTPEALLEGIQVGCTCRLLPSDGSWAGCKDGFWAGLAIFQPQPHWAASRDRPWLSIPQP